ncbi:hypothetical protein TRICHSKD4_4313 [Roseibium sp. TrichSKD4]|nr:hypothetical protein TRICHSKD4_4313 [Roseibium sp. TrichSKD4]
MGTSIGLTCADIKTKRAANRPPFLNSKSALLKLQRGAGGW